MLTGNRHSFYLTQAVEAERQKPGVITGLWPTPRAGKVTDEKEESWRARQSEGKVATPPLSLAVKMWPTPNTVNTTSEKAKTGRPTSGPQRGGPSLGLEDAVRLWPTPRAIYGEHPGMKDPKHLTGAVQQTFPTPQVGVGPNSHGQISGDFRRAMKKHLLPTPIASEGNVTKDGRGNPLKAAIGGGGSLNCDFVTWLMGWPRGWDSLEPLTEAVYEEDPWRDGEWPGVPRVAKGVPDRANRLRMLGNGWVPQCSAVIARRIMGVLLKESFG